MRNAVLRLPDSDKVGAQQGGAEPDLPIVTVTLPAGWDQGVMVKATS